MSSDAAPAPAPAPAPAYTRVVDAFEPTVTLTLSFGDVVVSEGAELTPTQAQHAPAVVLSGAAEGALFTVILSDPDAPSVADPKFGEWQHWVAVNCSAAELADAGGAAAVVGDVDAAAAEGADARTAFFGSAPGKDSGKHVYALVVYAQPGGRVAPDEPRIPLASGFPPRRSFNSRAFATKYGLVPAAAVSYVCEWDELVPELAKRVAPPAPA